MLSAQPYLAPACPGPFNTMKWQHCLSLHSLRADSSFDGVSGVVV